MELNRSKAALIVEDDPLVAMATQQILEDEGYAPVEISRSAKSAIAMLQTSAPALLVLDAGLADRSDGWSLAELARETISPRPKMLFVTGSPEQIPPEIARLGTVLGKPCSEEQLRAAVRGNG